MQDGPSAVLRRTRVLAGDQIAADDHMWLPVGRFRIDAAVLFKHIFHEERHDVGQSDGRLLRIGEAGHRPAFDQRGTVRSFRRAEGGWPVAHRGNAPAGRMHRLDQPDGLAILGQILQGSVSARMEDSIVVIGCHGGQPRRVGEERLRRLVLLEAVRRRRLGSGFLASGIDRRLPALGRSQGDIGTGIPKDIIGSGELLQPEAGLLTGVPKPSCDVSTISIFMTPPMIAPAPSGDLEASRESLAKSHPNALMAVNLSRCSD